MARPKKVKTEYKASIKVMGHVFTATGETVRDAITNLTPGNVKGRSILTIEKGEVKKERILTHSQTLRLFTTAGMIREIILKNTVALFDI